MIYDICISQNAAYLQVISTDIDSYSVWFSRVTRQMVAWFGRGGIIAWPPRSPDLTPLDLSVSGYVKKTKILLHLFMQVWKKYGHG